MNIIKTIILATVLCTASIQNIHASSNIGIVGQLYDDGHPQTGERGSVSEIASWNHFMYVSWQGLDGDFWLDVWNVRNPDQPVFVTQYSFGNIWDDNGNPVPRAFEKAPRHLNVVDNCLLLWSQGKLHVYTIANNGNLTKYKETALADDLNPELGDLSYGGDYAAAERQLMSGAEFNALIGVLPLEEISQLQNANAFINLENPKTPFIIKAPRDYGTRVLTTNNPISGTYQGMPAVVTIDDNREEMTLTRFTPQLEQHLNNFWARKFLTIFNQQNLGMSLETLLENIVDGLDLPAIQANLIQMFQEDLDLDAQITLEDLVMANYNDRDSLESVLNDYGINLEDNIDVALEKIIEASISAELDAALTEEIFGEVMVEWKNSVFSLPNLSFDALKTQVRGAMNNELRNLGTINYFVGKIMSPLLGNPNFMRLTLGQLVATLDDNILGDAIDMSLDTFHDVFPAQKILNQFGFTAPQCLAIPESSEDLLNLALYNNGARLNSRGLAFFELLKLNEFYSGRTRYADLELKINQRIQTLHNNLSTNILDNLFQPLGVFSGNQLTLDSFVTNYGDSLNIRKTLSVSVASAIKQVLSEAGVPLDLSVRELLDTQNMYVDVIDIPRGGHLATVADLIASLEALSISNVSIDQLFSDAGNTSVDQLKKNITTPLEKLMSDIFGAMSLDSTLEDAVKTFVSTNMDAQIFGKFLNETLQELMKKAELNVALPGVLGSVRLAAQGDCISKWQLAIRTAEAISADSFFGAAAAVAFEIMDDTLTEAYHGAIDYAVDTLMNRLVDEIMGNAGGSYTSWYAKLERHDDVFVLEDLLGFAPRNVDGFVGKDKVVIVARDQQNNASAFVFNPDDAQATLIQTDLGNWSAINSVEQNSDFVLISGTKRIDGQVVSALVVLDFIHAPENPGEIIGREATPLSVSYQVIPVNGGQELAVVSEGNGITFVDFPLTLGGQR